MINTLRWLLPLTAALLLSACASQRSQGPEQPINYNLTNITQPASSLLDQAQSTQGAPKQDLQLTALTKLLQDGNINAASQEINLIKKQALTGAQSTQLKMLGAYANIQTGQSHQAMQQLEAIGNKSNLLSNTNQILYYRLLSIAYQRNHYLATSLEVQLRALSLQPQVNRTEIQTLFRQLQTLSPAQLKGMIDRSADLQINAWLQLALIAEQHATQPDQLVTQIQQWQQKTPNQLLNQLIPANLPSAGKINTPSQIALLLPLHGKFSAMGQAVQNGFFAAYYAEKSVFAEPPAIRVYDTNNADIATLYQQAVNNGAQLIIGPLTKSNVTQLESDASISVPTITLNYSDNPTNNPNLMEFGLSPTQAATQAANKAWQYGIDRIMIITPQSSWGASVNQAFLTQWQQLGGSVTANLQPQGNVYNQEIKHLLKIDSSTAREQQLQQDLSQTLQFTPKRRTDTNGIFLAVNSEQAKQIRPLLKFYFAGRLPIFSTSIIYNGFAQPGSNRDLDGIYFADMPWVLNANVTTSPLKQSIRRLWPKTFKHNNRFFALGIDSFHLGLYFNRLITLPNFGLEGATGRLFLNDNQQVYRQLTWAEFVNGQAKIISK